MFPNRCTYSPRLRFIDPPAGGAPAGGAPAPVPTPPPGAPAPTPTPAPGAPAPVDLGFPAETAVKDMTQEQQTAYWKYHSRKHEAAAELERTNAKAAADKLEAQRIAALPDAERALAEARAAGIAEGSKKYLVDAVTARLSALTGKSDQDLAAALDLIDVTKLTQGDGTLDLAKLNSFAATIGTAPSSTPAPAGTPPHDAVRAAMERANNDPQHRGTGSIKELTKQRVADLTPTK